jgi:hypothetical protein
MKGCECRVIEMSVDELRWNELMRMGWITFELILSVWMRVMKNEMIGEEWT